MTTNTRVYSLSEIAVVYEVLSVLEGQGVALDSELDNWTFHAPFWAIKRHFGISA